MIHAALYSMPPIWSFLPVYLARSKWCARPSFRPAFTVDRFLNSSVKCGSQVLIHLRWKCYEWCLLWTKKKMIEVIFNYSLSVRPLSTVLVCDACGFVRHKSAENCCSLSSFFLSYQEVKWNTGIRFSLLLLSHTHHPPTITHWKMFFRCGQFLFLGKCGKRVDNEPIFFRKEE